MKLLSFDISSTTTSYAVIEIINNQINFISVDYIKPLKKGSLIFRLADTRDKIKKIIEDIKPDDIAIEDLIQFMPGKSTAKTILMLCSFNRMISLLAYDYLGREPHMYNVMSIRHGLKLNKILPKKEEMPEIVSKHLGITFPYIYDKKGKIKVESYDMSDAISVGLYFAFIITGKLKKKVKKKK